jgi:hypothetical protein
MLVTESEARTLWCSHSRVANDLFAVENGSQPPPAYNRIVVVLSDEKNPVETCGPETRCIASRCMSWRYHPSSEGIAEGGHDPVGYCGRAGVPA